MNSCIFCFNDLQFFDPPNDVDYVCNHCSKIYVDYEIKVSFICAHDKPVKIKNSIIQFLPANENGFVIIKDCRSKISKIHTSTFICKNYHSINYSNYIQLDNLNITPQNIKNKIYTIIAFS